LTADTASSRGHRLPNTHDAIDVYRFRPASQPFDTRRLYLYPVACRTSGGFQHEDRRRHGFREFL
jgi:hypothetical protein